MTVREHISMIITKRVKDDKIINQTNLASILEVSEAAVSKMMKSGQIDYERILKLCDAIQVSPNELLGYDENPQDREILDIINSDSNLKQYILSRRSK